MQKIDLGQTISILANVGVIAGIVFLGVEIGQNNELMEADARLNRANVVKETWARLLDSPDLADLLIKDRNDEPLSEKDELLLNAFWMELLLSLQWQYQEQLTETLLPATQRLFAGYPSLLITWQGTESASRAAGKDSFDSDFIEYVEQNVPALSESAR